MTTHSLSPLDQAHALRLAGDEQAALRLALACAKAAPNAPGPMALIARVLVDQDRTLHTSQVAGRLVDAWIRRGDLPSAVVASALALDAGEDQGPMLQRIALAFGKGSKLAAEVSMSPPAVIRLTDDAGVPFHQLSDADLFSAADEELARYVEAEDPVPADAKVPQLPLFGSLAPPALRELLAAVRVEEISGDNEVVRQGDLGKEAFVVARGLLRVVRRQGGDETVLAQLGPGAVFGEMALISEAPRSASVVASEPAQLLVLERAELERAASQAKDIAQELSAYCHARMRQNLVQHARVLSGLPVAERSQLLASLKARFFEAGHTLITRDQEAQSLYLIASGAVSVSVPEGGERLVLATLGPGDVVGEISLILRRPASADVVTSHPTVAYQIDREALSQLMRTHPALLVELYELATRRDDEIRAASGDDEELADDDALVLV